MPKRRCIRPLEKEDFQEASKPVVQKAAIFDPALYEPLIQIINELDPASFLKFSRTCRPMKDLCCSTKGVEIRCGEKTPSWDEPFSSESYTLVLNIRIENDESTPEGVRFELVKDNCDVDNIFDEKFAFSEELLEKVLKLPFRFVIDYVFSLEEEELNSRQMKALRQFLRRFPRIEIRSLWLSNAGTSDWNTVAEIVQEFKVKDVDTDEVDTPIPHDLLIFFVTNLTHFQYRNYVPDDVILVATAEAMVFANSVISVDTFKKLLEKFAVGGITYWTVGRQLSDIDDDGDPFRTACSDVMKIVEVEDVDVVLKDPGVLYYSPSNTNMFHMMRADGSTGTVEIEPNFVKFR